MINTEYLISLLKERDIHKVYYFHTDHFEPWSTGINDQSIKGVRNFLRLSKNNIFAKKMSLFYMINLPYILRDNNSQGWFLKGDALGFQLRNEANLNQSGAVIRELSEELEVEFHLHIHHERWTKNTGNYDPKVHQWLYEYSSPEMDSLRFDLGISVAKSYMEAELGRPFVDWAFVHGNWALNGSDSSICQIEDEIQILTSHGCWGDFTFPAGRGHCDPTILEEPYTCTPIKELRSYDTDSAGIRRIQDGEKSNNFFVWNSKIKANYSSLDYYYEPNCKLFKQPEIMLEAWFKDSFAHGGVLFIKTHSHSMKSEYKIYEESSLTPHLHPDVVGVFNLLEKTLDSANLPLEIITVNEVRNMLTPNLIKNVAAIKPTFQAVINYKNNHLIINDLNIKIKNIFNNWILEEPEKNKKIANDYYLTRFLGEKVISDYEEGVIKFICDNFKPEEIIIHEVGIGLGTLAVALAYLGYEVIGYESDVGRAKGAAYIRDNLQLINPNMTYSIVEDYFPDAYRIVIPSHKKNILLTTNIINTFNIVNQDILIKSATLFDGFVFDVTRFGRNRDAQESIDFMDRISNLFIYSKEIYKNNDELIIFLEKSSYESNIDLNNIISEKLLFKPISDDKISQIINISNDFYNKNTNNYVDALYEAKSKHNQFLTNYELILLNYFINNYSQKDNIFYEIGTGMGCLSAALCVLGFDVIGYEGDTKRYRMSQDFIGYMSSNFSFNNLKINNTSFPSNLKISDINHEKNKILISTNIVGTFSSDYQDLLIKILMFFNEAIIDIGRFGIKRDSEIEKNNFLKSLNKYSIVSKNIIFDNEINQIHHLLSRNLVF